MCFRGILGEQLHAIFLLNFFSGSQRYVDQAPIPMLKKLIFSRICEVSRVSFCKHYILSKRFRVVTITYMVILNQIGFFPEGRLQKNKSCHTFKKDPPFLGAFFCSNCCLSLKW